MKFIRQSNVVTPLGLTKFYRLTGMLGTGRTNFFGAINKGLYQWRAVSSETSHAIGMPKPGHKIRYFQDQFSS